MEGVSISKSLGGLSGAATESSKLSRPELEYTITTLAWALETIGVSKFAFIGSEAMAIFADTTYGCVELPTSML